MLRFRPLSKVVHAYAPKNRRARSLEKPPSLKPRNGHREQRSNREGRQKEGTGKKPNPLKGGCGGQTRAESGTEVEESLNHRGPDGVRKGERFQNIAAAIYGRRVGPVPSLMRGHAAVQHGTLRFQTGRVGTDLPPRAGQASGARPRSGSVDFSPRPVSGGRPARPPAWVRGPRRLGRAPPVGVQDVAKPMSPSPPLSSLSRSRSWCPFMVRTWISWLSGLSRAGSPP